MNLINPTRIEFNKSYSSRVLYVILFKGWRFQASLGEKSKNKAGEIYQL